MKRIHNNTVKQGERLRVPTLARIFTLAGPGSHTFSTKERPPGLLVTSW